MASWRLSPTNGPADSNEPAPEAVVPPSEDLEAAERAGARIVAYDPRRMRDFVLGRITLGELEGINKRAQYELAELGYGYLQAGQHEEALRIFRGLALLDPYDAYFQLALGWIAHKERRLDDAEQHLSRSLAINPYSVAAHTSRGEVRLLRGQIAEAVEDLEAAIELDPEANDPATHRAVALVEGLRLEVQRATH